MAAVVLAESAVAKLDELITTLDLRPQRVSAFASHLNLSPRSR
jgi:hypothetical protein